MNSFKKMERIEVLFLVGKVIFARGIVFLQSGNDFFRSLIGIRSPMLSFKRVKLIARAQLNLAACLVRTSVFATVILFLTVCSTKAPSSGGNTGSESQETPGEKRPPIALKVVQGDVERHAKWGELRKASCPRRIADRSEARRPFPAIDILHGLQYVTISDDSSGGAYEKVIELTSTGRRNLANNIKEESAGYIIDIAQREYLPGFEQFDTAAGRDDGIIVSFRWRWRPLNALGERLNLSAPSSDRAEHQGRATYVRAGDEWKLKDLWLQENARDYKGGLYK